jgi:hypothetical protein
MLEFDLESGWSAADTPAMIRKSVFPKRERRAVPMLEEAPVIKMVGFDIGYDFTERERERERMFFLVRDPQTLSLRNSLSLSLTLM